MSRRHHLPMLSWLALATLILPCSAEPPAPTLVALTDDGMLITFSAEHPDDASSVKLSGVSGRLLGVDRRPANGKLYGVTGPDLYSIDPSTGIAQLVSTLTTPFNAGTRSGIDFNPATDRLRLVGADGQNLRANVDNGATAVDGSLAFAAGDPHFGERPNIVGVAYTDNVASAPTTKMFDLDGVLDLLVRQDPPNDGTLHTVGALGVDLPAEVGFEIVSDGHGAERGFVAFGRTLYAVSLETGVLTARGAIGGGAGAIVGLTSAPGSP